MTRSTFTYSLPTLAHSGQNLANRAFFAEKETAAHRSFV